MKLNDLIETHTWEEVETALRRLYPDHESELPGYQGVYEKLKTLAPIPSDLRLSIQLVYSEHTQEFEIELKCIGPAQKEGGSGSLFALELTPWANWLGMELHARTLHDFSEDDILAHCLYQMTFFGFTQEDIQITGAEIPLNTLDDLHS